MQNHTVVQFPLESSRAIKKRSEVEIDVPWGSLPGMPCFSKPLGPRGISPTALLRRRARSPTLSSCASRCHAAAQTGHGPSLALPGDVHSPRHPTGPRRGHHRAQGIHHPAAMAPRFRCCGYFSFFIHQVLCHSVTSWM